MALLLPKLDDKPFEKIVEEGRSLIPSSAPEWTDHNVHDPGITFLDLFSWLAEIEHYRLERTSVSSYERFFSLMGIAPFGPRPAEVTVAFEFARLPDTVFVKANTRMWVVGNQSLPFATKRDLYLTTARLTKVLTVSGGRETVQTTAEKNEVGHFEAFGRAPEIGDSLVLQFETWFKEPQTHLTFTLFEDDLPARAPFAPDARGFQPSANVRWEYRTGPDSWAALDVVEDGTLSFSRSGELIFRRPPEPPSGVPLQLRALLVGGHFEIPPRIVRVLTNSITARQVETIVNEDLDAGLGSADQVVRLKKYPLLINEAIPEGQFQIGDVLNWIALIDRLKRAVEVYEPPLRETVLHIAQKLREIAGPLFDDPNLLKSVPQQNQQEYDLARAIDTLLDESEFYDPKKFPTVRLPEELSSESRDNRCRRGGFVRRRNRFLLQSVFPDLFVSDRLEIQTGTPVVRVEDEVTAWHNWQQVENFLKSGPADRHYVLDPTSGTVRFGNGLNGKTPQPTERIRARFYRYSQLENGNLPANHVWELDVQLPPDTEFKTRQSPPLGQREKRENLLPASGGRGKESIDETKLRSREVFRKEKASITARDYESRALNTPGVRVARVKVLPNFNPTLPRRFRVPGEITLLVLPYPPPKEAFPDAPPPQPSDGFLKTIQTHLESRRAVTTSIHVRGPRYVEVSVHADVFLKKRASETQARQNIDRVLKEFFDPAFGGPDKGQGWSFGRSVFTSEVNQVLAKVPEVDYVTGVSLNELKVGEPLTFRYDQLPQATPGNHQIALVRFESRGNQTATSKGKGGDRCE
jgi:hypothetical protein